MLKSVCTFIQLNGCFYYPTEAEIEDTPSLDMCSYNITLARAAKSQQALCMEVQLQLTRNGYQKQLDCCLSQL